MIFLESRFIPNMHKNVEGCHFKGNRYRVRSKIMLLWLHYGAINTFKTKIHDENLRGSSQHSITPFIWRYRYHGWNMIMRWSHTYAFYAFYSLVARLTLTIPHVLNSSFYSCAYMYNKRVEIKWVNVLSESERSMHAHAACCIEWRFSPLGTDWN